MEIRENPVFGRKIYFLNPSFVVENYIIDYLKKNEYEVYILSDFRKAKGILSANQDSMCFINIDSEMHYAHWYNFMKSFSLSDNLQSIYLGVISEKASWEDKDKFMMNIKLPGGFHLINHKTPKLLDEFTKVLDVNGAKGRRKFLRLDTRNEHDVSGYLAAGGKLFALTIRDISSAGFAVIYKQNIVNLFQKNTLLRNLNISAGRKSMVCSCIVFNTQLNEDGTAMSVLMLTNENPESTRSYIRDYIFAKNAAKLEFALKSIDNDNSSYTDPGEYKSLKAVANRDYDGVDVLTDPEPSDTI